MRKDVYLLNICELQNKIFMLDRDYYYAKYKHLASIKHNCKCQEVNKCNTKH